MAKFKYKTQMYSNLFANIKNIYADAAAEAKKIGISDELAKLKEQGRGTFGLTGGVSGCPAPLRDDVLAFSEKEAKAVKGLAGYVEEMRYMVKDFYGAEYDVCPTATCEAGINVCYTSMFMPPVMGAAAFVLADISGTPYGTVCLAALLMTLSGLSLIAGYSLRTCSLVGARRQSKRRNTVRGKITFLYSLRLYGPRSRLQMLQMKFAISV